MHSYMMSNQFQLTWIAYEEESGMLLREFISIKGISRAALTDIKFQGGYLFVNDKEETVRYKLNVGDTVKVIFPPEKRSPEMLAEEIKLDIVYEDDYVLIVNKPYNLPSIPSKDHRNGTLANRILHYYNINNIPSTVHIVTRLDKDTSGLMLIAKNRFVHNLFSKAQQKKTIQRIYYALVQGNIENVGTINTPIGRKDGSIIERIVREDGQHAVTHFEKISNINGNSLVKIKLETGRTHQIRVHFSSIGHSLLGDELYGGSTDLIQRQALHSTELSFFHPFLGREVNYKIPLPNDMVGIIERD